MVCCNREIFSFRHICLVQVVMANTFVARFRRMHFHPPLRLPPLSFRGNPCCRAGCCCATRSWWQFAWASSSVSDSLSYTSGMLGGQCLTSWPFFPHAQSVPSSNISSFRHGHSVMWWCTTILPCQKLPLAQTYLKLQLWMSNWSHQSWASARLRLQHSCLLVLITLTRPPQA